MSIRFSDTKFGDGVQARNFVWTLSTTAEITYPNTFDDPIWRYIPWLSLVWTKITSTQSTYSIYTRRIATDGVNVVNNVIYGRYHNITSVTNDPQYLQANEVHSGSTAFMVPPGSVLNGRGLIIPPGTKLVTSAASGFQAFMEGYCLEAPDLKDLLPYMGGGFKR